MIQDCTRETRDKVARWRLWWRCGGDAVCWRWLRRKTESQQGSRRKPPLSWTSGQVGWLSLCCCARLSNRLLSTSDSRTVDSFQANWQCRFLSWFPCMRHRLTPNLSTRQPRSDGLSDFPGTEADDRWICLDDWDTYGPLPWPSPSCRSQRALSCSLPCYDLEWVRRHLRKEGTNIAQWLRYHLISGAVIWDLVKKVYLHFCNPALSLCHPQWSTLLGEKLIRICLW